jgi:hypothetical protein
MTSLAIVTISRPRSAKTTIGWSRRIDANLAVADRFEHQDDFLAGIANNVDDVVVMLDADCAFR